MRTAFGTVLAGLALGAATGAAGRWLEITAPATDRPALLGESLALRVMVVVGTVILWCGWAGLLRGRGGAVALAAFAAALIVGTAFGYDAVRPHPSSALSGVIAYGPAIALGSLALGAMRIIRAASGK